VRIVLHLQRRERAGEELLRLHWAAYAGRSETLKLLLSHGADVEARTDDGRTTLHVAASRGHLKFLLELVDESAEVAARASNGWTALHYAVVANQRKTAQKLVQLGLRDDRPDTLGVTLAEVAERYQRKWVAEVLQESTRST
jgi:ankyrin repeat protein